jgi:FHS family L-fucose permease-like MFS transporter
MTRIQPFRVLAFNGIVAIGLVLLTLLTQGQVAMFSLLAVGLCNSIMFPTVFSLATVGMGEFVAEASGILCTAAVGGAIMPLLQGVLADYVGVHYAFIVPVICYIYIVFYALKGRRVVSLA